MRKCLSYALKIKRTKIMATVWKSTKSIEKNLIQSDNPCWGSTSQCDLNYLLTKIRKDKVVVFESQNYCVISKPPDLRMDGPYPATVHKLLTYWYPPPSLKDIKNKNALLEAVSKLHRHNDLPDNELRPCHQLDYATSGVLCLARNQEAAAEAVFQWEHRKVQKSYLAVLNGHIKLSKINEKQLPVLSMDEVISKLELLEQAYRNSRRKSKSSKTFNGFLPSHSMFAKWKSLKKANGNNKKRKRKSTELSEDQWSIIWGPVHDIVPDFCADMDWKELCKNNVDYKRAFQEASTTCNDLLRDEKTKKALDELPTFPTIFRVEHDLYIFCPLAQPMDEFAMKVPHLLAQDYPSLRPYASSKKELDFKPSLTKCRILNNEALFGGQPVTKVKLWPITGRRHQLRVHTALCGHAILGDVTYGKIGEMAHRKPPRMCLHAQSLSLALMDEPQDWSVKTTDPFVIDEKGGEVLITPI
jgi:23S rRNA-/tRNA-specific pseudouridylate synthase